MSNGNSTPDADLAATEARFLDAGDGLGTHGKVMARLGVSFDEYVIEMAGDDPELAMQALAEIGMTRTAAILRRAADLRPATS